MWNIENLIKRSFIAEFLYGFDQTFWKSSIFATFCYSSLVEEGHQAKSMEFLTLCNIIDNVLRQLHPSWPSNFRDVRLPTHRHVLDFKATLTLYVVNPLFHRRLLPHCETAVIVFSDALRITMAPKGIRRQCRQPNRRRRYEIEYTVMFIQRNLKLHLYIHPF